MCAKYKTFKHWDDVDSEEYMFQKDNDRKIDDPELNQDDSYEKDRQEFDDSDDFHKYDDTDEDEKKDKKNSTKANKSGRFDGNVAI